MSLLSSWNLIALYPRNGFISSGNVKYLRILSPPMSSVLITILSPLALSRTSLYDSNCSSSDGQLSASIYRNSDLNSPEPSAPLARYESISAGEPMFAATFVFHPSLDCDFMFTNLAASALNSASAAALFWNSSTIEASGW